MASNLTGAIEEKDSIPHECPKCGNSYSIIKGNWLGVGGPLYISARNMLKYWCNFCGYEFFRKTKDSRRPQDKRYADY